MVARSANAARSQLDVSSISPVVLMLGPETALADRALQRHRKALEAGILGIETTTVDARNYDKNDLVSLTSSSLFAEDKLLIFTHLEQATEAFQKDFLTHLDDPPPGIWVLASHAGGNRAPKVPRKIRKDRRYTVIDCKKPRNDRERVDLVRTQVSEAGGYIDDDAALNLVAALGNEVGELLGAASQLVFDSGGRITAEAVHTYHRGRIETKPYEVSDALADRNGARALLLARQAYATGVHPVLMVSVLTSKFRNLTKMKSSRATPELLGMSGRAWLFDKERTQARKWDERSLAAALVILAETDHAIKGESRTPEGTVELAIMKIANLTGHP